MRVPREFHRPAGAYTPGYLRWGPVAQPIRRLPVQLYRQRVVSVPLTGGQGQTTAPPTATQSGSATSPTVFQILATLSIPAGVTTVSWSVTLAGTVGAGDANNFAVRIASGPLLAQSVNAGAVGTYPQTPITVTGPTLIQFETFSSTPTTGATYSGSLTISTVTATISVGPAGLGNVWYPASATILTTSGVNDFSTCNLYLGPAGIPITLQGTIFPGGTGTASLAIPSMTPGQYIIAQWTGAHPGDTMSLNVVGTMDSVMP